ncbi:MAG: winged helix-turn-helix domain-containing protein, partial [Pyrinomonadaceae bacterium]|nr:winged helix-turn-helix domain-containing protein [Pyrinomonadaceae bacterium]
LALKEIEMLCVLTENSGEVVTKNDLLERVWKDSFVEESNLSRHIYVLRKTFKDFGESDNLIQTVPRRGYRFAGEVREVQNAELIIEKHTQTRTLIEIEEGEKGRRGEEEKKTLFHQAFSFLPFSFSPFLLFSLIVLLVGGFAIYRNQQIKTAEIKSIAVLPLKSFAADAGDESLRMRITDALITRLGGFDKIAVRPTNAVLPFAGADNDALEVGKKLRTDVVLDGRIQQEDERVRVTLQLINVADGKQLWAEQFDGRANEILNLQDAISAKVLKALNPNPQQTPELTARPTENAEAFEAYLQGRYFASQRSGEGLYKAVEYFQKAVALDSNFAEAAAGLADTQYLLFDYNFEVNAAQVALARENLQRALSLKPELAEALTTLGTMQMNYDWDWEGAEKSLKQATASAPNSPTTRMRYGALLIRLKRFDEAQSQFEQAIALDPLSIIGNTNLGMVYFCRKDYAAAERQFKKAMEINEKFSGTHWFLSRSLWLAGRNDEAIKEIVRALELDKNESLARRLEEKARTGTPDDAIQSLLFEWRENPAKTNLHNLAYLSAISGDREKAVFWLEKSFEEHHPWTTWIKAAPEFEMLHDEPRYRELLRKMNLTGKE